MSDTTTRLLEGTDGLAAEHLALTSGAGLADRSGGGRLRIDGADALDLLNRLTTNKLEELPDGHAALSVLTNADARVIDVLALGAVDGAILCLTSPGRAQAVIDWLDAYTFAEDIAVADRSEATSQLTLAGPRAPEVLRAAGVSALPSALGRLSAATVAGADAVLWRSFTGGAEGYDVIADASEASAVREALVDAGAVPVSAGSWETFRVANGAPAYGSEFGESTNPLESRLLGAISEDKGCYTGQEVIARLLTYKKVQRKLMSATLTGPAEPGAGLLADGANAGTLTSVAEVPGGGRVALAMVRMKHASAGRELDVGGAPGVTAVIDEPAYAQATEPVEA